MHEAFTVSPEEHPNTLRLRPSRASLNGPLNSTDKALTGKLGLTFLGRKQTHTLFSYSIDLSFNPHSTDYEAGVTIFLTQSNHVSLGFAKAPRLSTDGLDNISGFELRLRTTSISSTETKTTPIPATWTHAQHLRLEISASNDTHYMFSAQPRDCAKDRVVLGYVDAQIVSGHSGPFTGTLVGIYATCNGAGKRGQTFCPPGGDAFFSRWRYTGIGQKIDFSKIVSRGVGNTHTAVHVTSHGDGVTYSSLE
jgi:hypothetical protein